MRRTLSVPVIFVGAILLELPNPTPTRAEDHHHKPAHSAPHHQAAAPAQRSFEQLRPGGASVSRSVEVDRAAGFEEAYTRVVGPRGNTLERHVEVERTPFGIEREISSTRPGGAHLEREVHVERGPVVVERDSFVSGPAWGIPGPRSTNFEFFFGTPAPVVPLFGPPVVVAPPMVEVVQPPPVIVAPTPFRVQPAPVVVDPVSIEVQRLAGNHARSRQDACMNLGRMGDARAVVPLMERLKFDKDTHVREAAAWALGEIGDPRAALYLQRATIYDKKSQVRDEAKKAIARLQTEPATATQVASTRPSGEKSPTTRVQDSRVSLAKTGASTPLPPPPAPAPDADEARPARPPVPSATPARSPFAGKGQTAAPVAPNAAPSITREEDPLASPLPPLDPPR